MSIQRDYTPLIEAATKLLNFQYESLGYGNFRCRSCGSFKYVDYGDLDQPISEMVEECSKNCPWRQTKEAIDYVSHFHLGEI